MLFNYRATETAFEKKVKGQLLRNILNQDIIVKYLIYLKIGVEFCLYTYL